ncbi:MAG TPA: helix-turn-helix transcriptional regulator [Allosphingosinicella sp.]|jgi:transcriptional regulator with XRE-family HTH domain
MARAALGWSLDDLAAAAGVNRKTVLSFERGERRPRDTNAEAIRRAFEVAGVRFLQTGPDAGGVVPPSAQE